MKFVKLISFIFLSLQFTYGQQFVGEWHGTVSVNNNSLKIGLEIKSSATSIDAILKIPEQGLDGINASKILASGDSMIFIFDEIGISYFADISNENIIKGKLFQNNIGNELILTRGVIPFKRPQTPKEPFHYHSTEVTYTSVDGTILSGTITIPNKTENYPIVILVSGSGPQNRDGEMFGHLYYYVLADYLSNNGIGVLRFDERGVGKSNGSSEDINVDNSILDVEAAIQFLKNTPEYATKTIGLVGHSIGGIVAPQIALKNKEIKFLVLLAAPGINGDDMMLKQKAAYERGLGLNEFQILQGQSFIKPAYEIIKNTNLSIHLLRDTLEKFYTQNFSAYIPQEQIKEIVIQLTGNELIDIIKTKPSSYLSKTTIPVLALNGSKDFQVTPNENLLGIKSSLETADNKHFQTILLKNLNHVFQESNSGMLDEYVKIEQTFSPKALKIIGNWIKKTCSKTINSK